MEGREAGSADPYAVSSKFGADDLIDHPTFGLGIVKEARSGNKIEVLFEEGPKLLVHNR